MLDVKIKCLCLKYVKIVLNQRTNGPVNAHLISWPSTYKTWKIYG